MMLQETEESDRFASRRSEVRTVLERVRTLVANKDTWHQGELAADRYGGRVDVGSPLACKFCAMGAIRKVVHFEMHGGPMITEQTVLSELEIRVTDLILLNDGDGQDAVLRLLDGWLEKFPS